MFDAAGLVILSAMATILFPRFLKSSRIRRLLHLTHRLGTRYSMHHAPTARNASRFPVALRCGAGQRFSDSTQYEQHLEFALAHQGLHQPLRSKLCRVQLAFTLSPQGQITYCARADAEAAACSHRTIMRANSSNQEMKPTAPLRNNFSVFATTPCRGLSLSR